MTLTPEQREAISTIIGDLLEQWSAPDGVVDAIERIVSGPGGNSEGAAQAVGPAVCPPAPAPLADAERAELAQFRALRDMIAATDIGNSMEQAGRVGEWYNGPKACEERISLETSEPRAEMVARKSNLTAWGDAYLRAERALAMNEVDRLRQFCRRIARVGKGE
jgi:hypothetical protein